MENWAYEDDHWGNECDGIIKLLRSGNVSIYQLLLMMTSGLEFSIIDFGHRERFSDGHSRFLLKTLYMKLHLHKDRNTQLWTEVHTKGEEANAVILLWLYTLKGRLMSSFLKGLKSLEQCGFGKFVARIILDFANKMKKDHRVTSMPGMKPLLSAIQRILKGDPLELPLIPGSKLYIANEKLHRRQEEEEKNNHVEDNQEGEEQNKPQQSDERSRNSNDVYKDLQISAKGPEERLLS
jgi:hypothetical protein